MEPNKRMDTSMMVDDKGMVSIIIPMYNSEKYIAECIASVLRQTYYNIQIIVVDDGSQDKSKDILDRFNDRRLEYYFQENKGVSSARNFGLSKVRGEWILFLDADDALCSNAIELMLQVASKNTIVSALECKNRKWLHDADEKRVVIDRIINYSQHKDDILSDVDMCTVWGKLYDAKLIKDSMVTFCSGLAYGEDTLFNIELLSVLQCDVIHIKNELYFYRCKDSVGLKKDYLQEYTKQCNEYLAFSIEKLCFSEAIYIKLLTQTTHIIIAEDYRANISAQKCINNIREFLRETNYENMKEKMGHGNLKNNKDKFSYFCLQHGCLLLYVLGGRILMACAKNNSKI